MQNGIADNKDNYNAYKNHNIAINRDNNKQNAINNYKDILVLDNNDNSKIYNYKERKFKPILNNIDVKYKQNKITLININKLFNKDAIYLKI